MIKDVGLVVSVYDIPWIGDSLIHPGDGSCYTQVRFRLIIFRPFVGEVLVGKVSRSSPEGLRSMSKENHKQLITLSNHDVLR